MSVWFSKKSLPTKLEINDNAIKQVSFTTFLSITIDNRLNWAEHINQIKCKISKSGILNKAKRLLTWSPYFIVFIPSLELLY